MTHNETGRPQGTNPETAESGFAAAASVPDVADVSSSWREAAEAAIVRLAETGELFDAADVRALAPGEPAHPNHVGQAFSAMRRAGLIEVVSYGPSRRRTVRGSAAGVWRGTLAAREGRPTGADPR